MFELLTNSRRSASLSMTPGVVVSALLHASLLGALIYERSQNASTSETWTEVIEGLTYIAPPDVNSAASRVQVRYESGGGADGERAANAETGERAKGTGPGEAAVASVSGGEETMDQLSANVEDPFENAFSSVEVETAAERDPTSAAPAYPPHLMSNGIEGYAAMRFVVDTTGRVEMGSIRVLDTTHPEFAAAVKAAMPGMRFSPARLGSQAVRQLAEQLFRFQIVRSAEAERPPVVSGSENRLPPVRRPR